MMGCGEKTEEKKDAPAAGAEGGAAETPEAPADEAANP
jgi:hypothetical protein